MTDTTVHSRYERRVAFVADVIEKNSALQAGDARELAVKVVHAIDHIPEPTR